MDTEEVGVYHCTTRCVRQSFLCGKDYTTGQSFEHRRSWIADRLKKLSGIFGAEVLTYAVMHNHWHLVVRMRPDWVASWTDEEVARRWLKFCPPNDGEIEDEAKRLESGIKGLVSDKDRLEERRSRLGDLSWLMRGMNERIARMANYEDSCKGRFWEGRFKCQRLMDEGSILACMTYVDLNPVRAKIAETLDESLFTSAYDRLVAESAKERLKGVEDLNEPTAEQEKLIQKEKEMSQHADWLVDLSGAGSPLTGMETMDYLSLVEWTGKHLRDDKRGYIPADLEPLLKRFELDTQNWVQNVKDYGGLFFRVAGRLEQLADRARKKGCNWFWGHSGSKQLYERPVSASGG